MKKFLTYVAATVVGTLIVSVIVFVLALGSVAAMLAGSSEQPDLKDKSVLVLKLQGEIVEQAPKEDILSSLTANEYSQLGLNDILAAIKKAKSEDKVKGIYLQPGLMTADYATLAEIRQALEDFRKSGKWIIAYSEQMGQGGYYLASTANKIYLNPEGSIDWHGIASTPTYYKDLAAKFGVKYTIVKVGKFKSYTERYTEDKMSDANREQVTRYVNGLWSQLLTAVSKSRGISKDALNSYADGIMLLEGTDQLRQRKLIDGVAYNDEIKDILKKQLGVKDDDDLQKVGISKMLAAVPDKKEGDAIAVYYCEGSIVRTSTSSRFGGEAEIVAPKVIKDLEKMGKDDDIKAVVLRINSGGGDAYASEQIWHAVKKLNEKKPVVVSMSGMAASGAYYMSMGASYVMALPSTLTGSIGIFAALPDCSELLTKKLGLKYDEVKTNRNSAYTSALTARPMNVDELSAMQAYVNRGYKLFRQRVADGRKMRVDEVEKIAQGRVWLATDAKQIKLIDDFGGINDAIAKAAALAKVKKYHAEEMAPSGAWYEDIVGNFMSQSKAAQYEQLRLTLGNFYEPFMWLRESMEREPVQAALPFCLNIK